MALRWQIAELAVQHLLPSVYDVREYVVAGGLMSYGLDLKANSRPSRQTHAANSRLIRKTVPTPVFRSLAIRRTPCLDASARLMAVTHRLVASLFLAHASYFQPWR